MDSNAAPQVLINELDWEIFNGNEFVDFVGFSRSKATRIVTICTSNRSLRTTKEHQYVSSRGLLEARDICVGDRVHTTDGIETVTLVTCSETDEYVYDALEASDGNLFAANDFIVHNCILLDEFAHVPTGIAQEFFESVLPTITSGATSKLVINSTPKGLNMFHKMWKDAVNKKNGFVPIDVHYSEVPGRDRKWAETTRKAIGEDKFKQEFDTQFIGSTATLVVASKLETLTDTPPVYSNEEGLRIFKQPMKNRSYVLTADVSGGNGADYQATSVFDISKMPYEQVATYRNNRLSPLLYPNIIEQLGKKYNDALVLVEMNNEGSQVSNILRLDLEYENVATINTRDNKQEISGGFGSNIRHGLLMNKQTKRIGCSNLKAMVESDQLLINDLYTINELLTFVAKNASYAADTEEDHDDMVMTLVSFAWLAAQPQFKELTDLDLRKRMFKDEIARIEQEFLPFGFVVGDTYDTPDLVSPDAVWSKVS